MLGSPGRNLYRTKFSTSLSPIEIDFRVDLILTSFLNGEGVPTSEVMLATTTLTDSNNADIRLKI